MLASPCSCSPACLTCQRSPVLTPAHGTSLASLVPSAPWMSLPSPAQRVAQCPSCAGTSSFQTCFPSISGLEGLHRQSSPRFSPITSLRTPLLLCFVQRGPALPPASFPPAPCPSRLVAVATGCIQPSWSGASSPEDVFQVLLLEDLQSLLPWARSLPSAMAHVLFQGRP